MEKVVGEGKGRGDQVEGGERLLAVGKENRIVACLANMLSRI